MGLAVPKVGRRDSKISRPRPPDPHPLCYPLWGGQPGQAPSYWLLRPLIHRYYLAPAVCRVFSAGTLIWGKAQTSAKDYGGSGRTCRVGGPCKPSGAPLLLPLGSTLSLSQSPYCAPGCHLVRKSSPGACLPEARRVARWGTVAFYSEWAGWPHWRWPDPGLPSLEPRGTPASFTLCRLKFTDICWFCLVLAGAGPGQGCSFLAPRPFLVYGGSDPSTPSPPEQN